MSKEQAAKEIADILRPFIDPSNTYFDEDQSGPHEIVREITRNALQILETPGLGRCRLCLS